MKNFFQCCFTLIIAVLLLYSCSGDESASTENTVDTTKRLFTLLQPDQTGVTFQNTLTEGLNTNILMYEYFYNGGGIASGDFNGDGLTDLYFTSNMGENKFYLNKGNFKFQDITPICGAAGRIGPWKTGANAVDINADGKLDIYLCYSGAMPAEKRKNQLFINKGNDPSGVPMFEEQAEVYGLASTGFSNQSYFFDFDKDGDLDMLLLNHNPKNLPLLNEEGTAQLFKTDNPEKGLRLYKQTNGKFEDITQAAGINGSELSYGLGLAIADYNGDDWPDFYVSNDYAVPDYYYINNKNGSFTNQISKCIGHTSQFSMGNDAADINNDGLTDLFTLDMLPEDNRRQKLLLTPDNYEKFRQNLRSGFYYQYMRNMLQLNNGNGTFSEIGQLAGVSNTDWSWSALLADYDNDGWKDLYVTNGYLRDYTNLDFINYMNEVVKERGNLHREEVMDIVQKMPSSNVKNYMFHNKQNGFFENNGEAWGFNQNSNSNGAVYADLDNDGDLDLVVNNINQPAFVYRNEAQKSNANHFLTIQLQGAAGNTQGIGAKLQLYSNRQLQTVEQYPARGYLSNVSFQPHFGLGNAAKADSLIITWSSGKQQKLYNVNANQAIILAEKDATLNGKPVATSDLKWFMPANVVIPCKTPDTSINDFNRQLLLISQLSYAGPCITKFDLDKDGLEDLLVGGGAGEATRIFMQQKNGTLSQKNSAVFVQDKNYQDAAIAVLDANADGYPDVYIASGGYGSLAADDTLLQDRLYINDGKNNFIKTNGLPAMRVSKSCVATQDINGDGYIDLFVGGRVIPGRYPETPRSYVLINDGKGNFSDQTEKVSAALSHLGMVTDAKWIDLDGDKKNELVVAGEWMPVTVFANQNGKLVDNTTKYFDKPYSGWWNVIETADINGDQKPDLLLGNMGLNTQFTASEKEPLEMYYDDFDKNGSIDPIFSFYIKHKAYPYVTKDELVTQLPVMRKRFFEYKSYADVTMDDLFQNGELNKAKHLAATEMASVCFVTTASGKFKTMPLPAQAQYSPLYAISVLDFDNDGKQDLLVCGNNSHAKIRLGKFDANYGFLLKGDGAGNFSYIDQTKSGLDIWGDVRSCARLNNLFYFGINGKDVITYALVNRKK